MFHLTYYKRMLLSFMLFIIVPMVAVSVQSFYLIKESMLDKLHATNENMLNVIGAEFSKTIDDATFASHFIVNDEGFKTSLRQFADVKHLNSFADYENFSQIKAVFSLINSKTLNRQTQMYLINRQHFIIPSGDDEPAKLLPHLSELYSKINFQQPERLQWLGLLDDKGASKYYIARVIYDRVSKGHTAVLLIGIEQSYFENALQAVKSWDVALLDEHGDRIAGSAQLLASDSNKVDDRMRSEVVLSKNGWKLVYEMSNNTFRGIISKTLYIGSAEVMLFVIIFSLFALLISKRLHRPIEQLQQVAGQFGNGKLDVRLQVKGDDELAAVSKTINLMLDQLQQSIYEMERQQEQRRVLELEALFMQIRPHFLLNTLNSIKCSLMLQKDRLHSGMIDSLMSLLRAYMNFNALATLQEECELMAHYIDIMQMRSDIPIQLQVDIEPQLQLLKFPKLLLQPLVENAIIHGFVDTDVDMEGNDTRSQQSQIWISVYHDADTIVIEVADNGAGMDESLLHRLNESVLRCSDEPDPSYKRVGLVNVAQRLKLSFGSEAALSFAPNRYDGITARMQIPVTSSGGTTSDIQSDAY
ncbi:histidine kinase [Paenibacillus alvei]|nr:MULTISPECIES: histidine kinase [Paenibacillus]EJW17752.1 integral membrane sensor signal transduction histidine kinase [Paenibacillus alvei DSM 29]MCY7483189.1 histidine kinase [Paenibacillus alvei]MCY9543132.1 histidine kinase [Paenibacillus alvei]MCY9733673.1 histidine kinase [Paenibacillus alvei]MCY9755423.1 histidine kinase [Paenibacillus alvei]